MLITRNTIGKGIHNARCSIPETRLWKERQYQLFLHKLPYFHRPVICDPGKIYTTWKRMDINNCEWISDTAR